MVFNNIRLLIFLFLIPVSVCAQKPTAQFLLMDPNVQKGLSSYLEKIPVGHEGYFGFTDRNEFQRVSFGQPLPIYTISGESNEPGSNTMMRETSLWYIPLTIDSEYRCFLQVREEKKSFKAVGFGFAEVAKELDNFEQSYHLKQADNKSLLIDQSFSLFCLITDDAIFYPIRPLPNCQECQSGTKILYSQAEILNVINSNNYLP